MESKTKKQSIRLLVKLSEDRLRAAQRFAEQEEYRDAISRAYYGMFHIVKALLLTRGQTPSSHRGINILFNKFFIKTRIIDKEFSKLLLAVREERESSDYEPDEWPDAENALAVIRDARKFIKKCKEVLEKEM